MLRILGQLSLFGTKVSVEGVASLTPIPRGLVKQIGLKRKPPETDHWCYESPLYRFHPETIDEEVRDFAFAHARLGEALANQELGITHAFLTLCPVEQSLEEEFACVLSAETLRAILHLGVGLQIAPAKVMPDAPYWKPQPA
jgi:hypothetical protein